MTDWLQRELEADLRRGVELTNECPAWFNRRHQYNYGSAIDYQNDCIVRYCKCGATRQEPRF